MTDPRDPGPESKSTAAPDQGSPNEYVLKLYVTGSTSASLRAIQNIKRICNTHLAGGYDLEVIDIYLRPDLAKGVQIIAAPTLIKLMPSPLKRLIGDMSNEDKVLIGLDLHHLTKAARDK